MNRREAWTAVARMLVAASLLAPAAPAQEEERQLAGWLTGRAAPADPAELGAWRQRLPDLDRRLIRLSRAPDPALREGALQALRALRQLVPGALGEALAELALAGEADLALASCDLLQERADVLALCQRVVTDGPLPLRLRVLDRLGALRLQAAQQHVRTLRRDAERLPPPERRRVETACAVALLRMDAEPPAGLAASLLSAALDDDVIRAATALEGLRALPAGVLQPLLRDTLLLASLDLGRRERALCLVPEVAPGLVEDVGTIVRNREAPWAVRQVAVQVLGRLQRADSAGVLAEVLAEEGDAPELIALRREAVVALAGLGADAKRTQPLTDALFDPEATISLEALRALPLHPGASEREALLRLLRLRPLARSGAEVVARLQAAQASGLDEPEAAAQLLRAVGPDDPGATVQAAVDYSRALPDVLAVPFLLEHLGPQVPPLARSEVLAELRRRSGERHGDDPSGQRAWRSWWEGRQGGGGGR